MECIDGLYFYNVWFDFSVSKEELKARRIRALESHCLITEEHASTFQVLF
jgi:hypothetical protein